MNKSESIAELATALSKLQGELKDAPKETQAFNYKYANLSAILEMTRPLLVKNNLSVVQLCLSKYEEGQFYIGVETVLTHKSGEFISSEYYMPVQAEKNLAHGCGKVVTYCRRYAVSAVLGLTQCDSDSALEENKKYEALEKLIVMKKVEDSEVDSWKDRANVKYLDELSDAQIGKLIDMLKGR